MLCIPNQSNICYKIIMDEIQEIKNKGCSDQNFSKLTRFQIGLSVMLFIWAIGFGPGVWYYGSMEEAGIWFIGFPALVGLIFGFQPTGCRVRVKWSSRKEYFGDFYLSIIFSGAILSGIATLIVYLCYLLIKWRYWLFKIACDPYWSSVSYARH